MKFQKKTLEDLEEMAQETIVYGVFKVDDADYHAFKALNSTSIKAAAVSLADFNAKYNPKKVFEEPKRPAYFAFGTAFHAYMLDMPEFKRSFVVKPNSVDLRKLEGKAWRKEHPGKDILSELEMMKIETMASNLLSSKSYKKYLKGEYHEELALFWPCEITGLQCKAKLDLINKEHGGIDLKTTAKPITDGSIAYGIKAFSYHIQQAHYVAGVRACLPDFSETFAFGWSQKDEPFGCRVSVLKKADLELVEKEYESLMLDIQYGLENDFWPFPGDGQILEVSIYGN